MVALALEPGPHAPAPDFTPSRDRMGPFMITSWLAPVRVAVTQ
jgi:hypothetical protein